jgi:phosphoglycerate kinase
MKTVQNVNFKNVQVVMRVDFNVPLNDQQEITDDSRIRAAAPTIKKILQDGGSVVLLSHLGRPKAGPEDKFSLRHIVDRVAQYTESNVHFSPDCIGTDAENRAKNLAPGEVLLLENVRFYKEETKGDKDFARKLSQMGDFYVNDAFGACHRAHASTAIMAGFFGERKCFGLLMAAEIENARKVMNNPGRPFTAIVGGAKVSDKLLIIENLMDIADNIIIGGGMAYTFAKAKGGNIGNSLCENDRLELCSMLIDKAKEKGVALILPSDSKIADRFAPDAQTDIAPNHDIPNGYMGLDIGPDSIHHFCDIIAPSKTILWNGPMGVFEFEAFETGTKKVGEAIAAATDTGAFSLIGGGDSAAAVYQFGLSDRMSYVSTGGGALLEYFEGKVLPGIAAVEEYPMSGF